MDFTKETLDAVLELVNSSLKEDMMVSSHNILLAIKEIITGTSQPDVRLGNTRPDHIVISCYAEPICDEGASNSTYSRCATAYVIQHPSKADQVFTHVFKINDVRKASYAVMYMALNALVNLVNSPGLLIELRVSDSKVIEHLLDNNIKDEVLDSKRETVQNLVVKIPAPVIFKWRPACTDAALRRARLEVETMIGVKNA